MALVIPMAVSQEKSPQKKWDPDKPAGEQFKNVQLLKAAPSGQFIGYMNAFNAALGVNCAFCHLEDKSSDDKMEKVVARKMLTMTGEINAKFFAGKMEVRCYTCHKGAARPVSEAPSAKAAGEAGKQ